MDVRLRTLDHDDPREVYRVARAHEETPAAWQPGHRPPEAAVVARARDLAGSRWNPLRLLLVAEHREAGVVGFHWIDLEVARGEVQGHIVSLWVDPRFRGNGLARRLKARGEAWAREAGARSLRTTVHFRNDRMVRFNLRAGFEPGFVEMVKRL